MGVVEGGARKAKPLRLLEDARLREELLELRLFLDRSVQRTQELLPSGGVQLEVALLADIDPSLPFSRVDDVVRYGHAPTGRDSFEKTLLLRRCTEI